MIYNDFLNAILSMSTSPHYQLNGQMKRTAAYLSLDSIYQTLHILDSYRML